MITRFEQSNDVLVIEVRRRPLPALPRFALVAALFFVMTGFWLVGLNWVFLGRSGTDALIQGAASAAALTLVVILGLLTWFAYERERLALAGGAMVYDHFFGPIRIGHRSFNLLKMRGLQSPWDADPGGFSADRGFVFWYEGEPVWIGRTLEPGDYERFVAALLEHERAVRESMGIHGAGLGDIAVWTPERRAYLARGTRDWSARRGRII